MPVVPANTKQVRVLASARVPSAALDVVELEVGGPIDHVMREEAGYRLELSLTPRIPDTKLSFPEHWPAHRSCKAGKLFLLPPRHDLRIRSDPSGQLRIIICQCQQALFDELLDEDFEPNARVLEASSDFNSTPIAQLLTTLAAEASRPAFAREIIMEAIAIQIAAQLARELLRIDEASVQGGLAPWRLRMIDDRLEEPGAPPTLTELAALCRISTRQLARGFRVSRGVPLGRYANERRLDAAKTMLAAGKDAKSVAYALGFSSPSSFSASFRRFSGFAPKSFKN